MQLYNMDVTKVKVKAVDNVYHLEISIGPSDTICVYPKQFGTS